jgi:uncharacterized membrane protein YhaH (DUF805 family)
MSDADLDTSYPGVGRLHFFLGKVGLSFLTVFLINYFGWDSPITRIGSLAIMIAGFVLDVMRLRNIGVSQWFAMLRFIPYVNLLYMIGLQSAQAGWIETRRLDRTGITLAVFQVALLVLMILMVMRMGMAVPFLL